MTDWKEKYYQMKSERDDLYTRLCRLCRSVENTNGEFELCEGIKEWWDKEGGIYVAKEEWGYLSIEKRRAIKKHIDKLEIGDEND
jgi:hypothetical protein